MNRHYNGILPGTIFLVLVVIGLNGCAKKEEVTVPALVGQTVEVARNQLAQAGLAAVETTQAVPGAAVGTVVDQNPKSGVTVPAGSTVTLVVAGGSAALTIPNVVGLMFPDAKAQIEGLGLQVKRKAELVAALEFKPEQVVRQQPAALGTAEPGAQVELEIAGAPVAVPDVKGKGLQEATQIMSAAKLLVSVAGVHGDPRQGVASTTPPPGEVVLQGSTVALTFEAAPPPPPPMEVGIDRKGQDYTSFDLAAADPTLCFQRCEADATCRAWTYVKPGVQGPKARCWLKNAVPAAVRDGCCTSGVKPPALKDRLGVKPKAILDAVGIKRAIVR